MNCERKYGAIALIEYQGTINREGQSQGHYICDIKNNSDNCWYRTNDNNDPIPITVSDVTKKAYVVLFRRV